MEEDKALKTVMKLSADCGISYIEAVKKKQTRCMLTYFRESEQDRDVFNLLSEFKIEEYEKVCKALLANIGLRNGKAIIFRVYNDKSENMSKVFEYVIDIRW